MILRGIYWTEFALHGTKGIVILPDMMAWHIWANTSFTPAAQLACKCATAVGGS